MQIHKTDFKTILKILKEHVDKVKKTIYEENRNINRKPRRNQKEILKLKITTTEIKNKRNSKIWADRRISEHEDWLSEVIKSEGKKRSRKKRLKKKE